ncbi:KMT5A methyltransferase, partial [Amia calva]|nr:KMT5A methyltransferase [Amia calva]
MVINDMIQLSAAISLHVLSYIFPVMNVSVCTVLVLIAFLLSINTPLNLAGMAVERYIAICDPLRHSQICTVRRTYTLIALICIDASAEDETFGRLVNDDPMPNTKMKKLVVKNRPHLCLFALRDILPGEEITYDYGGHDLYWRHNANQGNVCHHFNQIANFLGHDVRVHRNYYRSPEATIQLAKVSKL